MNTPLTRTEKITLYIKARGHGKSTDILGDEAKNIPGIIPTYQAAKPHKSIIVFDIMDAEMYHNVKVLKTVAELKAHTTGVARIVDSDEEKLWHIMQNHIYNSLIIVEDATRIMGKDLSQTQKKIVYDTKQKGNDMFFLFHDLVAPPNKLIKASDWLVLGKTNETYNSTMQNKWPIGKLREIFNRIKKHPNKYYKESIKLM